MSELFSIIYISNSIEYINYPLDLELRPPLSSAYGTVELISDKQQIAEWGGDVESSKVLVRVHLEKVFPHCGKAIGKADLWNHESWQNEASADVPGLLDMAKGMASARRGDSDK